MIKSIRQSLLIYLGIAIFSGTIFVSTYVYYFLNRDDLNQHLDSLMALSAIYISSTVKNIDYNEFNALEKKLDQLPETFEHIHRLAFSGKQYARHFHLQMIDKQGKILASSPHTPLFNPKTLQRKGFQTVRINQSSWRLFIIPHQYFDANVVLSENIKYRQKVLLNVFIQNSVIFLVIFPFIGIVLWFLIQKSLQPIFQVTYQVSARNPHNLDPLNIANTPKELSPLILALNQLLKRLKDGISREREFTANAAHELRTPLAVIKTLAQTAAENNDIHEIHSIIHKIDQSVDRGSHVVQQLMNMSKTNPEAIHEEDFVQINLADITRDTLAEYIPKALEKGIEIEFETEPNLEPILANKISLVILIGNLVDNSIRYTYPNTTIYVHVYHLDKQIVFEIRDEGPGIPKNKRDQVFERFYRIHKHKFQGSGLGLAIVKQIVNQHHAQITIESPLKGHGVIFRIFFPKAN